MSISDRASRAQAWEHSHFSERAEWLAWLRHSEGWGGVQSHWGRGKQSPDDCWHDLGFYAEGWRAMAGPEQRSDGI